MRKTFEEIIKILKDLAIDIHNSKISLLDAQSQITGLVLALEKYLATHDSTLEEKLDFLIFMASKRVTTGNQQFSREVVIPGEQLFKQWKDATAKADEKNRNFKPKPLPNELDPNQQ